MAGAFAGVNHETQGFSSGESGVGNFIHGGLDIWVGDIAGVAKGIGEIIGADEDDIDVGRLHDGIEIIKAFGGFDLCDDERFFVGFLDVFA